MGIVEILSEETNPHAKKFYSNLVSRGYQLHAGSRYEKAAKKLKIICPNGHIWETIPYTFNKGHMCKRCKHDEINNKIRTAYKKEFEKTLEAEGYVLVSDDEYTNSQEPALIKHISCGHEYRVRPALYLSHGTRCPKCAGNLPKSHESFIEEVKNLTAEKFVYLNEYSGANEKITIKHDTPDCGLIWETRPVFFIAQGARCPGCEKTHSKGEDIAAEALRDIGVEFMAQKTFPGLKIKNKLRFDFYLPVYNALIEMDGHQHFRPVNFSGDWGEAEENFKMTKLADELKESYAKINGFHLLRIPYWEFKNSEKIIKDFISELETT